MATCVCQNCDKRWDDSDLNEIEDFSMRVGAGEICPAGECPDCGAVCHEVKAYTFTIKGQPPQKVESISEGHAAAQVLRVLGWACEESEADPPRGQR